MKPTQVDGEGSVEGPSPTGRYFVCYSIPTWSMVVPAWKFLCPGPKGNPRDAPCAFRFRVSGRSSCLHD